MKRAFFFPFGFSSTPPYYNKSEIASLNSTFWSPHFCHFLKVWLCFQTSHGSSFHLPCSGFKAKHFHPEKAPPPPNKDTSPLCGCKVPALHRCVFCFPSPLWPLARAELSRHSVPWGPLTSLLKPHVLQQQQQRGSGLLFFLVGEIHGPVGIRVITSMHLLRLGTWSLGPRG